MFTKSARFYNAIYSFKDYAKEANELHEIIGSHLKSGGNTLLDVACGTGKHLGEMSRWYDSHGVDLDSDLLGLVPDQIQKDHLHAGDMRTFELGFQVDVVTCLFSSIGYMTNLEDLRKAAANMARHLKPGGVMIVEPWLYKENYKSPHLHMLTVDEDDLKISRISQGSRRDDVSVIDFQYLIVTHDEVIRESEHHELGLYDQAEYQAAMEDAGLTVDYDPIGPMGRGLFVGSKPSFG